ncbi:MAG: TylF/MycF family methyltransferase [Acidobacteriota bacterium]|nr:TylF/MycF family methyltransferase [Acidobacteriota bacterium]
MYENLSLSGRIRYRLSRILWPQADLPWTYEGDGFATLHSASFREEPSFRDAYRRAKAIGAWHGADIEWRAYTVCWAAMKARAIEGDYVECGVDRGGFSLAAMHYVDFASLAHKKFYLVDTYEGIPPDTLPDDARGQFLGTRYDQTYDDVVRTFAPFPNAVIVRGKVPEILPSVTAEKLCYLCIDLNTAGPSVAAAEFFWDRLSSGAPIVLDDYGQTFFSGMQTALDDFARHRGVQVLPLPTGQGLIFKP